MSNRLSSGCVPADANCLHPSLWNAGAAAELDLDLGDVPSWASGQGATDFTLNVTRYYANNFDIMWTQGMDAETRARKPPGYGTWEAGTASDCAKVHAVRPGMPTFGYYGFYGCCDAGADNAWFPQFTAANASHLWLKDDTGKVARYGDTPIYDFCEPRMLTFYKEVILADLMSSGDIHGSFFDEVDSFVEGCCGNHPWCGKNAGAGGQLCTDAGTYHFSDSRKAAVTECWMSAMEELVVFMTAAGKFPIPSTNAYQRQYPAFYKRQRDVLASHGGFKFVEAFCPATGAFPSWVCPMHNSREACCLDQLLSIKEHASLGIPLMIHTDEVDGQAVGVQLAAFLIAAQKWSYVAVGNGWNGPGSFPLVDLLQKPLGAPKGDAVVIDAASGVFTREFDRLSLKLNVTAWSAEFKWL